MARSNPISRIGELRKQRGMTLKDVTDPIGSSPQRG